MDNQELADECLTCLDKEQAYLDGLCEKLNEVRQALLSNAFTSVESAISQVPQSRPEQLRDRYARVTPQLATYFKGSSGQITLDHLAKYLGQTKGIDISANVRSIRQKRRNVAMLNRSNLAIAGVLSRVVDRFVQHVTGVQTSPTYSRFGTVQTSQSINQIERSA